MRLAIAAAILAFCGEAGAYVRSRTAHGTPTHWTASCVIVQPDAAGTSDLPAADLFAAIKRSMDAWRTATAACGYMTLDYVEPAPLEAHFDGTNTIKFRGDRWCHPDDSHSSGVCYDSIAAGITTVFYVDRAGDDDGRLLDADVELNTINFTFDIVGADGKPSKAARPSTTIADLENTLVHELGHVQGLDHTCKGTAPVGLEVDENGQPLPDCNKLSALPANERAKITDATMFISATPAEIKKRSPEPDDVAGICNAYPTASDPGTCAAADLSGYGADGHGCAAAPSTRTGASCAALAALVLAAALAHAARRRRR